MKNPPGMQTCCAPGGELQGTSTAGLQVPTREAVVGALLDVVTPVCASPESWPAEMHVVSGEPKLDGVPRQSVASVTPTYSTPAEGRGRATRRSIVTSGLGSSVAAPFAAVPLAEKSARKPRIWTRTSLPSAADGSMPNERGQPAGSATTKVRMSTSWS